MARKRKAYLPFTAQHQNQVRNDKKRLVFQFIQFTVTLSGFVYIICFISTAYLEAGSSEVNLKPYIKKTPTLVWYTDQDVDGPAWFVPKERTQIDCSSGDKTVQCDVIPESLNPGQAAGYLFYGSLITTLPVPRHPKTLWGLVHEESPKNVLEFMYEDFLNLFNFSSTFSRYSNVPMPLLWMLSKTHIMSTEFFVTTLTKNSLLSEIAPVLYLQTDCNAPTERDDYVKKLMEYIPIDSYGKCLNNRKFPTGYEHHVPSDDKHYTKHVLDFQIWHFIARYKFVIGIESGICNDYVTELFWRAIALGVVPIYFGSPLIRDWMPNNKSAILLEDYSTPEDLSKHLHELLKNDTKYEEYLEHKTKRLITNEKLLDEIKARPHQTSLKANILKLCCLMCKRVHDSNSSRVNMVTKSHYDCPMPVSALTLSVNPDNTWVQKINKTKNHLENLVQDLVFYEQFDFSDDNKTYDKTLY